MTPKAAFDMLPQFDECNAGYRALQGKTSPPTGRVSALDG